MDTGLFTGEQPMSDAWKMFRDFVERTEDLPVAFLVKGAVARGLDDDVFAAYDAPFPEPAAKAGARAFPLMLPTSPETPGAAAGKRVLEALREDKRPKLVLWADPDPIIPFQVGERFAAAMNADPPEKIEKPPLPPGGRRRADRRAHSRLARRVARPTGELSPCSPHRWSRIGLSSRGRPSAARRSAMTPSWSKTIWCQE